MYMIVSLVKEIRRGDAYCKPDLGAVELTGASKFIVCLHYYMELMKGKALRKHSLHEKTTASVLLKLSISGNEWCHTTDAPMNTNYKLAKHKWNTNTNYIS